MEINNSRLYGQINTGAEIDALASKIQSAFQTTQIEESDQYTGGKYINVLFGDNGKITFERINDHEYVVFGEAESIDDLNHSCELLCEELTNYNFAFSFEIYDANEDIYAKMKNQLDV